MEHGDLSNKPSPRIVVVFEGAVATIPVTHTELAHKMEKKGDWFGLITRCYELNDMMLRKLLDLTWRKNINVQLVTWLGAEAAAAIQERMEDEGIPLRGVFHSTPERLARDLSYNPDIIAVYDPDPAHQLTYPLGKGVYLTDITQLGRIF